MNDIVLIKAVLLTSVCAVPSSTNQSRGRGRQLLALVVKSTTRATAAC